RVRGPPDAAAAAHEDPERPDPIHVPLPDHGLQGGGPGVPADQCRLSGSRRDRRRSTDGRDPGRGDKRHPARRKHRRRQAVEAAAAPARGRPGRAAARHPERARGRGPRDARADHPADPSRGGETRARIGSRRRRSAHSGAASDGRAESRRHARAPREGSVRRALRARGAHPPVLRARSFRARRDRADAEGAPRRHAPRRDRSDRDRHHLRDPARRRRRALPSIGVIPCARPPCGALRARDHAARGCRRAVRAHEGWSAIVSDLASVRFVDPWVLALLAVVLIGIALSFLRGRRPSGGLLFPSLGLLPAGTGGWRVRLRWTLVALRVAAIVLFIVALARPQIVRASVESVSEGIDIALAIDVSGSMSEAGFGGTTKIDAVKHVVHDFLGGLKNDRVGIVIFSGEAIVLGPPTLDYAASQKLVDPIETGTLTGGTAIGTGLATGINVVRDSDAKSKVVILLTDGENNGGDITPLDAANMAKLLDVRVYTIGAITLTATADKDVSSDTVDEQLMRKIAEDTGGHYYSVSDENSLAEVYREIESLEKSHVGTRDFIDYQEAQLAFLALGIALLFAELALGATVFRRTP